MPEIIYGSLIAEKCRTETAEKTAHLKKRTGKAPRLDVIIAGDNPASRIYVRNKEKAAATRESFPCPCCRSKPRGKTCCNESQN